MGYHLLVNPVQVELVSRHNTLISVVLETVIILRSLKLMVVFMWTVSVLSVKTIKNKDNLN